MKRLYKITVSIILSAGVSILLMVTGFALESNIDDYADEFDFESVTDSVSDETVSILQEIGIDEISYEKLFSVDISKVFKVLLDMSSRSFKKPVEFLVSSIGVIIITSLLSSFIKSADTVKIIGGSVLALCAAVPIAETVTTAFSVLETLTIFTTAFAGVFCALVSSSGNIALGTSYASLAVLSDSFFSGLLSGISKPAVNAMCTLGFLSCFDVYGLSSKLCALVKKIYISFLGFIATFFSGIVTIKGVMGAGADSLTSRGVRFVVGRTLPIVGGAVSETYSALVSSLSLIKNTVGIFGIVTVVLTVLPSLLEILSWVLVLSVVSEISGFLNAEHTGGLLNVLKDALTLLGATVIFCAVIFVVSVGVVIFVKGV